MSNEAGMTLQREKSIVLTTLTLCHNVTVLI